MESVIAITGAYERGHGLSLPEMMDSGETDMVRLFESTGLKANRSMSKTLPLFSQKPIETSAEV